MGPGFFITEVIFLQMIARHPGGWGGGEQNPPFPSLGERRPA